ncbi:MAG: hypothetical protein PF541_03725, partial [Prolixibacteraceae bacterium]|nr:hypothetical protein [Prolixibacteraceae bacterium]
MKKILFLSLLTFFSIFLFAEKYEFEKVELTGVENPVYTALSADGLRMIIVDQPKKGFRTLKQCNRPYLESRWGAATNIEAVNKLITKDTRIDGPAYTFDNKYLFFAANFEGGFGGLDIYSCEILDDEFANPVNLGTPINSPNDENFPSISGNRRIMFFTREIEMKKLGDYQTGELFRSTINPKTETWTEAQKVNTQINNGGIAYPKIYDDNKTIIYSKVNESKDGWEIFWAKQLNNIHWYLPVRIDTLVSMENEISPFYCKQDACLYFVKYD